MCARDDVGLFSGTLPLWYRLTKQFIILSLDLHATHSVLLGDEHYLHLRSHSSFGHLYALQVSLKAYKIFSYLAGNFLPSQMTPGTLLSKIAHNLCLICEKFETI